MATDGWYLLAFEGCSSRAVRLAKGKLRDVIEESNIDTHLAANDHYVPIIEAIHAGRLHPSDGDEAGDVLGIYCEFIGDECHADMVDVSRIAL
jgi:hypothetical protein